MKIDCIPSEYIIKVSRDTFFNENKITDFSIKALRFINTQNRQIKINSLEFSLQGEGKTLQTINYRKEHLQKKSQIFSVFAEQFLKKKTGFREGLRVGNLQKMMGTEEFWDEKKLTFSTVLNPHEEFGLIVELFTIHSNSSFDQLTIRVKYFDENEEVMISEKSIPLIEYPVKSEYIFPVKGKWHMTGSFDDYFMGHRIMYSQEFAFDLDKLPINEPFLNQQENSLCSCYKEEIYAIADGEVVTVFNKIPENPTAGSDLDNDTLEKLWKEFGYEPLGPGNLIVIEHPNNEYSFYAHMMPSSNKVKVNDKVKQGQIIGLIGNSGNSDGPHLHFQLMNKNSTQTGRGLPCTFNNLYDCYGTKISTPSISSQIIYAK